MNGGGPDLRRALQVFEQVADLAGAARDAQLDALCAADPALRDRVERMLAADARADDAGDGPAARWNIALRAAAGDDPMLGRLIGAWRLVAVAGRGGMGVVYEAERADGAYAQRAALKLIQSSVSAGVRERFLRERQVLAQLRHAHIAALLDGGFSDAGEPYFVMEYVDGLPIDRWCDARRLGVRARVELFAQALGAVGYAHRNLLVHRDLKPSNLLVDAAGRVKLLDFGIVKQLQDPNVTALPDRAATFAYAAPEQLHDAPITTATDLWQLGVVLHVLLSGSHPFGVAPAMPLAKQLQQMERPPETLAQAAARAGDAALQARGAGRPADLARQLRGGLATIVATCLRRDPAQRYASVDALAADLQRWLQSRPVLAARTSRRERARLWLRRNRLLAASVAAVTVALLAGTGVSLWQARQAQRESARARESLQFLADTLAAAAPEQALSREVSVRQLLDSARRQLERRSTTDPALLQPVQRMLGRLYFSVGDFQRAAQLLDAGTHAVAPRTRDAALSLADDLIVYSDALGNLEQGAASVAASERAAALRERFAPDDAEQQLRALAHQTLGHVEKYGWEACRRRAEQALAMARRLPNPPVDVMLRLYSDLGSVANFTNDRSRLLSISEEGLAFADRHDVPLESPLRFSLLRNRIEGLMLDGRAQEAETLSRDAIAMIEKTGGVGSTRLGVLWSALGMALRDQGRYRDALTAMSRAHELVRADHSGPRNIAVSLSNIAMLQTMLGDDAKGLRIADQSLAELDRAGVGAEDPFRVSPERIRVHALLANHRVSEAAARLQTWLEIVRRTQGADSEAYVSLLIEKLEATRQAGDAAQGQRLLAEVRERAARRGMARTYRLAALFLRYDAAFARLRGDLPAAEDAQRQALQNLLPAGNAFEIAIARAELADILGRRGHRAEARRLLAPALPVLRQAVLPAQRDRQAAEALAARLGLDGQERGR
ncbi:serine/threonine-protein kinase [Solimonas soli]|uniref:serine/threonine-protein kinase n=1 Tax=Solimonas soli TaxID=413479 RepID=UPI000487F35E|nr:serine/threonine-protein kinase [Solimonas soli]